MGKKSRKQQESEAKQKLCPALSDKGVVRLIDSLLEKTSKFSSGSTASPNASTWEEYDAIVKLVHAIEQRQGPSPMPLPPRKESMDEFVTWLASNGAKFEKVEIMECPGSMGFGLKARVDIKEEERVLEIPSSLFFSKEKVMSVEMEGLVRLEPLLTAMPNLVLALLLLNERYSQTSFWKPYINALPESFDLPLYFSKEDLLELQGSPVLMECISQVRNIARLYAILHRQLRAFANFSLPICTVGFHLVDFKWAVSCVMSRQNKVPVGRALSHLYKENQLVLIPLWDMANHTQGRILSDFDTDTQACVSYSMSDLSPGDEFRIFYGPRGNGDMILNQGFAIEDNNYDFVKVWIGLSSVSNGMIKKVFKRLRLAMLSTFTVTQGDSPFGDELIAFVRLLTMPEEELKKWEEEKLTEKQIKEILNRKVWTQGDQRVMEFLEKRCQLLQLPYKTTIEEDRALLRDDKITGRTRNIIILRLMEKLILKSASEAAASLKMRLEGGVEEIAWNETSEAKKLKEDENKEDTEEKEPTAAVATENGPKEIVHEDNVQEASNGIELVNEKGNDETPSLPTETITGTDN